MFAGIGRFHQRLLPKRWARAWLAAGSVAEIVEIKLDRVAAAADVGQAKPVEVGARFALLRRQVESVFFVVEPHIDSSHTIVGRRVVAELESTAMLGGREDGNSKEHFVSLCFKKELRVNLANYFI